MEEGSVVWAKFAHYPYWPSRTVALEHAPRHTRKSLGNRKEEEELVWFFGSHNYAYVASANVIPWKTGFETYAAAKKTATFKNALKEAEKWLQKTPEQKQKEILKAIKSDSEESSESESGDEEGEDEEKEKDKSSKKEQSKKENKSEDESESRTTSAKSAQKKKDNARSRSSSPKKRRKSTANQDPTAKSKKNKLGKEENNKSVKSEEEKEKPVATVKKIDSGEGIPWTQSDITNGLSAIQRHPISKYYKLKVVSYDKGKAHLSAVFSDVRAHCVHEVHSCVGAGHFLLDVACYVALMKDLVEKGHSPLTQGFQAQILEPIKPGESVEVTAVVKDLKEAAGLAFLEVKMTKSSNGELLMSATVIKTLLAPIVVSKKAPTANGTAVGSGEESKKEEKGKETTGLEPRRSPPSDEKMKLETSLQETLPMAMTPS